MAVAVEILDCCDGATEISTQRSENSFCNRFFRSADVDDIGTSRPAFLASPNVHNREAKARRFDNAAARISHHCGDMPLNAVVSAMAKICHETSVFPDCGEISYALNDVIVVRVCIRIG